MKISASGTSFVTMSGFWLAVGITMLGYIFLYFLKTLLLYISILNSNVEIHKEMIHSLVRSPSSYFDITPTGQLNNKFSNDLGIMDGMLAQILKDSLEGPIFCLIMLLNVFSINLYFLIPGVLNIVFVVWFYLYCK